MERLKRITERDPGFEFPCCYDLSTDDMLHFDCSEALEYYEPPCPYLPISRAERQLGCLERTRPFLTRAFSNPALAKENDLLGDKEGVIVSSL